MGALSNLILSSSEPSAVTAARAPTVLEVLTCLRLALNLALGVALHRLVEGVVEPVHDQDAPVGRRAEPMEAAAAPVAEPMDGGGGPAPVAEEEMEGQAAAPVAT